MAMTIEEAREHVGSGVVYRPYEGAKSEDGTIVRVGTSLVFVLYAGDTTPKGTRPEDLTLLAGGFRG